MKENIINSSNRNYNIDLLKAISIFCVVLVHTNARYIIYSDIFSLRWTYGVLVRCIIMFCVCMFYMCSGILLYNNGKTYKIESIFKNKVLKLITILLIWDFIYKTVDWYINGAEINKYLGYIIEIFKTNNKYHLYYLYRAIFIYLFYPIGNYILKDKRIAAYFLVIGFIPVIFIKTIMLLPNFSELEGNINQITSNGAMEAIYFSILGSVLYKNYFNKLYKNKKNLRTACSYGIVGLVISIIMVMMSSKYESQSNLNFTSAATIFGTVYTISILFKGLSIGKIKEKYFKLLEIISDNTLYIYVSHILILEFLERAEFYRLFEGKFILKLIYPFITAILIIIIVLLGTYIYKKIKMKLSESIYRVTQN